jgi:hypothetical protein
MVYFTTDPIPNPVFFRRVDGLWRYDAEAELQRTDEFVGGSWVWTFRRGDDEWTRAFSHMLVDVGGVTRIREGDNRRLPTGAFRP